MPCVYGHAGLKVRRQRLSNVSSPKFINERNHCSREGGLGTVLDSWRSLPNFHGGWGRVKIMGRYDEHLVARVRDAKHSIS